MTAIERFKRRRIDERSLEALINRIAIEHALREAFGEDAYREVRIEHTDGNAAVLHIDGHVSFLAHMRGGEDGIGWDLTYSVGNVDERTLRFESDLGDALLYAEKLYRSEAAMRAA